MGAKKIKKRKQVDSSSEQLAGFYVQAQETIAILRGKKRPRDPELRAELAAGIRNLRALPRPADPRKREAAKTWIRNSIEEFRQEVIAIDTRLAEQLAPVVQKWVDDLHTAVLKVADPEPGVH